MNENDIVRLDSQEYRVVQFIDPPVQGYDVVLQNVNEGYPMFATTSDLTVVQKVYVSMDRNRKYSITISPNAIYNAIDTWEVDLSQCRKL